jgi:hypothetical protein
MKIYQPMMYVGLGGTGGLIGAELERRLREELCGPDGTALVNGEKRARFQLPDCLQFVYADFSETELGRLPHLSADGPLRAAYARTSRATHDLLPRYDSSPEVTRMLRIALPDEVSGWLPPYEGEPRVAPLHNGAGQLPTVGRAALFATLRNGLEPVLGPIRAAIDALGRAAGDLRELGGQRIRGCDVFVGFSVAGGTGAGIFYDYLHLLGEAFKRASFHGVKIYPLVVMPSAFPPERGGGREAELNAARAVVDLFRLVDDQNVPSASADVGHVERKGSLEVKYPGLHPISLRTSTTQTAFLFSRTAGIRPEDLRRSIVSLVMSLIGTELDDGGVRGRADDDYQTFAASFVNRGVHRAAPAPAGVGRRGVSTSLVASMTVPVDELAEIVAARMLAAAVRQLTDPDRRGAEDNERLVRAMFGDSGVGELWSREALPVPQPDPLPRGSNDIEQALRDRVTDMENMLGDLHRRTGRRCAELAETFKPRHAAAQALRSVDLFRLERVVNGQPGAADRVSAAGFAGMVDNRRKDPERPPDVKPSAPPVPRVRGRAGGVVKARWGDPVVSAALEDQDRWYGWRSRQVWHRRWREQENRWRPPLSRLCRELAAMAAAFRQHEEEEAKSFGRRVHELYRDRTGVSYLLPPQGNLPHFYDDLMTRLLSGEGLPENTGEGGLLLRLVQPEQWQEALSAGQRDPGAAVSLVKNVIEQRVKRLFVEAGTFDERPLLPSLAVLLDAAAGDEGATESVSKQALDQFNNKLAGLLPAGFTPEGNGPLKILIVYPKTQAEERARRFLERELHLPSDADRTIDSHAAYTESITVVMLRSQMSLTEVPEVRKALQLWARTSENEGPEDVLEWRQRLGYEDDWLASTESDRAHILHRLLCAMWNGRVEVEGAPSSPSHVRISLRTSKSGTMTLALDQYGRGVSSWSGLLRGYERYTMLDEGGVTEEFCRVLMAAEPEGLATSPRPPDPLFRTIVHDVAPQQVDLLDELADEFGEEGRDWVRPLRQFWAQTLPAALDLRFPTSRRALHPTLSSLDKGLLAASAEPPPVQEPAPAGEQSPNGAAASGSQREAAERSPWKGGRQ